jgi:hypothetical protein
LDKERKVIDVKGTPEAVKEVVVREVGELVKKLQASEGGKISV